MANDQFAQRTVRISETALNYTVLLHSQIAKDSFSSIDTIWSILFHFKCSLKIFFNFKSLLKLIKILHMKNCNMMSCFFVLRYPLENIFTPPPFFLDPNSNIWLKWEDMRDSEDALCPFLPTTQSLCQQSVGALLSFIHLATLQYSINLSTWAKRFAQPSSMKQKRKTWTVLFIIYSQLFSLVVTDISKYVNDIKMHYTVFTKDKRKKKRGWGCGGGVSESLDRVTLKFWRCPWCVGTICSHWCQ